MNTVQLTKFGRNQIGKPYQSDGGCIVRDDTYTGNDGTVEVERRFALNHKDFSDMFIASYGGDPGNGSYHPQCSCCYLGNSHTLARHNAAALNPDGTPRPKQWS